MYELAYRWFTKFMVVFLLKGTFLYLLFGIGVHLHSMDLHPDPHGHSHIYAHSHNENNSSHQDTPYTHTSHNHDHAVYHLELFSTRPSNMQALPKIPLDLFRVSALKVLKTEGLSEQPPLQFEYSSSNHLRQQQFTSTFTYRAPPLLSL